ncbi:IS66 family transposase zinc-finger binding domain-containing protein [Mesorhizobium muleiense]|uniref:IS66 family transposase zinc-finger binding domain-containing protein n=1 Tax=Mesorhizobium muleiense TaxID=1004279 RepID=UPI002E3423E1|nr:IS66 family transposase zinc-finger binding domain-containing protein [Mesorhizobium muleiense]
MVIEPETPAGCEALEKILIGEDVSERLDVTPAKFRVIVTRRDLPLNFHPVAIRASAVSVTPYGGV